MSLPKSLEPVVNYSMDSGICFLRGLGPNGLEVLGAGDTAGRREHVCQRCRGAAGRLFLPLEEQRRREELEALKSAGPSVSGEARKTRQPSTATSALGGRHCRGQELVLARATIFRLAR